VARVSAGDDGDDIFAAEYPIVPACEDEGARVTGTDVDGVRLSDGVEQESSEGGQQIGVLSRDVRFAFIC
jgi:hypothetical protein